MKRLYYRPKLSAMLDTQYWQDKISASPFALVIGRLRTHANGKSAFTEVLGRLLLEGIDPLEITSSVDFLDDNDLIEEETQIQDGELSAVEIDRYRWQMKILTSLNSNYVKEGDADWFVNGVKNQLIIKSSTIILVDSGASGSNLIRYLALSGIGHIIATSGAITYSKKEFGYWSDIDVLSHSVRDLNPYVKFTLVNEPEGAIPVIPDAVPSLIVYFPDQFSRLTCEKLNKVCLEQEIPFLPIRNTYRGVDIGPLVLPKATPCFICYSLRRVAAGGTFPEDINDRLDNGRLNIPLGIEATTFEILKFVTGSIEPVTKGRLWRMDFTTGLPEVHPVLKLPRCPACGVHKTRPLKKLWSELKEKSLNEP